MGDLELMDLRISADDLSAILRIIASVIDGVEEVSDDTVTDDRYVVDVEATLRRIVQRLNSKADEIDSLLHSHNLTSQDVTLILRK